MRLREIPGPFDNPEGCDSDFRLEHLQPWETREHRALQHSHAFHLRYYHTALETKQTHKAPAEDAGRREASSSVWPPASTMRLSTPIPITPTSRFVLFAAARVGLAG